MSVASLIAELLAPEACVWCGAPGCVACAACLAGLAWIPARRCARCGVPTPVPAARCAECPPGIARAEQACAYDAAAAVLVASFKDRGRPAAADVAGRAMAARCRPPPPGVPLVPVPTTPARRRARGLNPARRIADAAAAVWGCDVREGLLERVRDQGHQRGSGRDARRRQVAGAFRATGPAPAEVWLVDDVVTTGATLSACAHALRQAGARRVGAVAFARVTQDLPHAHGRRGVTGVP